MQTINISKKRFESLQRYQIPNYVYNTEGTIYELPIKNKWETQMKLLKRLYLTNGAIFGNKLQTINSLIDSREQIGIDEIVFPEKIAIVDSQIVGFTMPLIESINLKTAFLSKDISTETKISYLKQNSKYLSSKSFINQICKYQKNEGEDITKYKRYDPEKYTYRKNSTDITGAFIPDENTDIYCYIMVILNFLYGDNIGNFTIQEFYDYLEYLKNIGIDFELIKYFEKIASNSPNENPYELLDSLTPFVGRSNHRVYSYIRNKSSN